MTTLSRFFQLNRPSAVWARRTVSQPGFAPVRSRLEQKLKGVRISDELLELLVTELVRALNLPVPGLFLWGWRTSRKLSRFSDPNRYPPGRAAMVPLLEHTLESSHEAKLTPVVNGQRLPWSIKFDVVLQIELEAGVLKIRDGKIEEVRFGSATGSGSIEYKGVAIIERKMAPFELPVTYRPEEPFQI